MNDAESSHVHDVIEELTPCWTPPEWMVGHLLAPKELVWPKRGEAAPQVHREDELRLDQQGELLAGPCAVTMIRHRASVLVEEADQEEEAPGRR